MSIAVINQRAAQAVADFRTAIDTLRTEFAQKQDAWGVAADELEPEACTRKAYDATNLPEDLGR
jgi:hypothetical protein